MTTGESGPAPTSQDGTGGAPPRALRLSTAAAAGLLALIHVLDLVQSLVGLDLTAYDLTRIVSGASRSGSPLAAGLPLNAAQTLALAVLSAVALIGGSLTAARGGALCRIGGALAVTTVVLPLTLPVMVLPGGVLLGGGEASAGRYGATVLLARSVSAAALVTGLLAAALLLAAPREDRSRPRRAVPAAALLAGGAFLVEELAALVHLVLGDPTWWAPAWLGSFLWVAPVAFAAAAGLTLALVLGAMGAGGMIASSQPLVRVGGVLLMLAVLLRVLTQVVSWGMIVWIQRRMQVDFDLRAVIVLDTVPGYLVPALAGLGLILGAIGVVVALARSSVAPSARP
ncbi:hypothetical protein [Brachybacterium sp. YJGR34]|uniref:hypothetical protein n=1 Tax=Brachybacterium sp. YJGR34 TaxID=2059911 RepID=UPI000E0AEB2F|nr:hypothetical protein [Brachybacterium sp. YJGR34]